MYVAQCCNLIALLFHNAIAYCNFQYLATIIANCQKIAIMINNCIIAVITLQILEYVQYLEIGCGNCNVYENTIAICNFCYHYGHLGVIVC